MGVGFRYTYLPTDSWMDGSLFGLDLFFLPWEKISWCVKPTINNALIKAFSFRCARILDMIRGNHGCFLLKEFPPGVQKTHRRETKIGCLHPLKRNRLCDYTEADAVAYSVIKSSMFRQHSLINTSKQVLQEEVRHIGRIIAIDASDFLGKHSLMLALMVSYFWLYLKL